MDNYDNPWKELLDEYFESFLLFCFPRLHQEIDWSKGYQSLDKELEKLLPESDTGRRVVDKLIQVSRKSGGVIRLMIHAEVQNQPQDEFAERMFVYHYRIRDRYNGDVVSLAVLGDAQHNWRPDRYQYELFGCSLKFRFPIIKLLDYSENTDELEQSDNPVAILIHAHLRSLETKRDPENRYVWKFRLVKGMYERGWSKDRIRSLFRFIDWLIELPPELAVRFKQKLSQLEEEKKMPYVTSIERLAREEGLEAGREAGLLQGIKSVLEVRFGEDAKPIIQEISQLANAEILEKVLHAATTIDRPNHLASIWNEEGK